MKKPSYQRACRWWRGASRGRLGGAVTAARGRCGSGCGAVSAARGGIRGSLPPRGRDVSWVQILQLDEADGDNGGPGVAIVTHVHVGGVHVVKLREKGTLTSARPTIFDNYF